MAARWQLGTGETLAIAISFGGDTYEMPAASGSMLCESDPGVWDLVRGGSLPGRSAVAWIEPAGSTPG